MNEEEDISSRKIKIHIAFGYIDEEAKILGTGNIEGEYHEVLREIANRYILFRTIMALQEETKECDTFLGMEEKGFTPEEFQKITEDLDIWISSVYKEVTGK